MRTITRHLLAAALLLKGVGASACPLCMGWGKLTPAQQLVNTPQAVLAVPTADAGRFRVIQVVKGERPADGIVAGDYPRNAPAPGNATPTNTRPLLLVRDDPLPTWVILGTIDAARADWLRALAAGKPAPEMSPEEWSARVALVLGLDKNDEIVKRRMAQKMQFLAEDVAAAREPSTEELKAWHAKNSAKFAMPKRVSFRHLYFSPDRRATHVRNDAVKALPQLGGQPEDVKLAESFADPFMFQEYYRDKATDFLGKEFGPQFAQAVEKLPTGSWQGPIESGFGWHLVFVDTAIPGRVPEFEEIEADVKTAWLAEQKVLAWDKAYQEMRAKYTVLLPRPPENASATLATNATAAVSSSTSGRAQ